MTVACSDALVACEDAGVACLEALVACSDAEVACSDAVVACSGAWVACSDALVACSEAWVACSEALVACSEALVACADAMVAALGSSAAAESVEMSVSSCSFALLGDALGDERAVPSDSRLLLKPTPRGGWTRVGAGLGAPASTARVPVLGGISADVSVYRGLTSELEDTKDYLGVP